jgi:hypothetical protein
LTDRKLPKICRCRQCCYYPCPGAQSCRDVSPTNRQIHLSLDPASKTYQNFKTRMTFEYQLQNQMTSTARDAGYHANAVISDNNEASLASAAQDFAATSATGRSAFEQLTNTNGDLTSQVANMAVQNLHLQQQMSQLQQHMMHMATVPPPPAAYPPQQQQGGRGRGRGRQRQAHQQRHRPQQQPPQMQMPYGTTPPPYGRPRPTHLAIHRHPTGLLPTKHHTCRHNSSP